MRKPNFITLLSKENSILALIDLLFEWSFDMYSKNPLAINSKFLNSVLNFLIYISCYSVIDGFYIIKFLLESLKELSVFVV